MGELLSRLPETRHIRVGYLADVWGDITLTLDDQPHYHGHNTQALRNLYTSITMQLLYRGLTPAQTLARMADKMSGPVWAVCIGKDGQPHGGE